MGDTILLAGGGKMGSALLAGWMERGIRPGDVTVVEPDEETAKAVTERFGVTVAAGPGGTADAAPGAVVLAVKPQSMDAALSVYKGLAGGKTVFLSIAAGKTIAYFEDRLGPDAAIVRAMPNTPAAVGRGI
ncbi:MAG: NAD(P)-binding domain-containing protein, partial [Proteobacteria bacterium]|nr:NAD(P)-binding domain-containing protein [Pseudomonadota bacterium]